MADDITKKYLDEEGLKTYDAEIKKYALEKTSVEYSKEYSFAEDPLNRIIMISVNTVSTAPFLVALSVEMGAGGYGVEFALHGTVVVSLNTQGGPPLVNIYNDATGEMSNCIKYSYSETNGLKLYVIGSTITETATLHVKAVNTDGIDFSLISSSTPISHLDSPKNVLATTISQAVSDAIGAVTGTITSFDANRVLVSNSSGGIQASNDITTDELNYLNGVTTSLKNAAHITEGTLPVARGGTGKDSHTTNAVLTGNNKSAIKNVPTKSGAFYATATNGAATFGTLPIAQGGTGRSSLASEEAVLLAGPNGESLNSVQISGGAFYCPNGSTSPRFETLPIEYGGTGATTSATARTNIGIKTRQLEITMSDTNMSGSTSVTLAIAAKFAIANISGISKTLGSYDKDTTLEHLPYTQLAAIPRVGSNYVDFCITYSKYSAATLYFRLDILYIS